MWDTVVMSNHPSSVAPESLMEMLPSRKQQLVNFSSQRIWL